MRIKTSLRRSPPDKQLAKQGVFASIFELFQTISSDQNNNIFVFHAVNGVLYVMTALVSLGTPLTMFLLQHNREPGYEFWTKNLLNICVYILYFQEVYYA